MLRPRVVRGQVVKVHVVAELAENLQVSNQPRSLSCSFEPDLDLYLRRVWRDPLVDGGGVVAEVPFDLEGLAVDPAELVVAIEDRAVRGAVPHRVWDPQMVDFETPHHCENKKSSCAFFDAF